MTRRELGTFVAGILLGLGLFYIRLLWVVQVARTDRIESFLSQAFSH